MPCALTQGYNIDCKENIGGVRAVWFIGYGDVSAVSEASGVVTAITKVAGKSWYKYNLIRNTASWTETPTGDVANGTMFWSEELTIILNKLQANTRNEIQLLSRATVMSIVQDNNGKYWLVGKNNGLDLTTGSHTTGTASGDRNGYTLTFNGEEREMAVEVNTTVMATL